MVDVTQDLLTIIPRVHVGCATRFVGHSGKILLFSPIQIPITTFRNTAAGLAQSVKRLTAEAGGRGFDSCGRNNTQGLKITEK